MSKQQHIRVYVNSYEEALEIIDRIRPLCSNVYVPEPDVWEHLSCRSSFHSDKISATIKYKEPVTQIEVIKNNFHTVVPEGTRPKGYWHPIDTCSIVGGEASLYERPIEYHYCSVCGRMAHLDEFGKEILSDYCPDCGADLRGESKMRLIDADEAYKILTEYYHHRTDIQHKALTEALDRVPTVEERPKSKWVECDDIGMYYVCSNCRKCYVEKGYETAYCSHCGAEMEVENDA